MNLVPEIAGCSADLAGIRRDLHAHPEIGFEERRTSDLVARLLTGWGVEVHRGLGTTGVVGVIRGNRPGRRVGLRADMDALPMTEATGLPHASRNPGVFHGCGHDGHTTMLLGAGRYLAQTRRFPGEVVLIFQPAEEGLGGARRMLADGLFDRFPCDEIYAIHNWPGAPLGRVSLKPGVAMAASDSFDIVVTGKGSHGAQPHLATDPVMAAVSIAQALQTIVSRNVDPLRTAIVSVTQVHAGSAYNVIPDTARIGGTIRTFDEDVRALVRSRMTALAQAIASGFGAKADIDIRDCFSVLRNSDAQAEAAMAVARDLVGPLAELDGEPKCGSEDFADMLAVVPGAYLLVGQGDGANLHSPRYDFNDDVTPIGASLLARIAEHRTAA
ncbi:M20 aminoacylase family protein [Prosthecomicrobium sp. N25]|uniref:M20 aminoacylase family protein n=1 Tax=Prosthecomicrobium sp. N25 TaxID=3129254 RepID=UPI003076F47D